MSANPLTLSTAIPDDGAIQSVLANRTRPARSGPMAASITFGWRALLKLKYVPLQIFDVTMFPIMITLMFTYLFGGALAGSVSEYVQQLIPGILVMTVAMISMYTATGINTDITKGVFDRFRSLPFWRPAILVGALLGDTVRYSIAASVVIILGLILGFRPEAGLLGVISAFALLLFFAFSLSWIWTALGILMPNPEAVMMTSGIASFPLTFASNIFVDPATMPAGLRAFVNINPISLVVTAVRGLIHGTATSEQLLVALLACVLLIAVFGPITMYLFHHKGTR